MWPPFKRCMVYFDSSVPLRLQSSSQSVFLSIVELTGKRGSSERKKYLFHFCTIVGFWVIILNFNWIVDRMKVCGFP